MVLSPANWHSRFIQQAGWTRQIRQYLYERAGVAHARRVLDIGCGTGALLAELVELTPADVYGLDIDSHFLALAASQGQVHLTQADAHCLPYAQASFDVALCHFLLLWVADPRRVVAEMRRVVRPGGNVLALAEPDYGGRIDYPAEFAALGRLQAEALRRQGANPDLGRKLGALFSETGLKVVETGVLGGRWSGMPDPRDWELEWQVLEADLGDGIDKTQFEKLRALDAAAWQRGARLLFVPTFYAWGVVAT